MLIDKSPDPSNELTGIITLYIKMQDSDWLIAVIFFLQIQALHCEFAECLLHVGVFA
jgi:hypothetical protein